MTDTLPSNTAYELTPDDLLAAYRMMRTIRDFEERVHDEFATGAIPGFVHLYAGEEASAVGVCFDLDDRDSIASTHRGHGHCIAKGVDVGDDGRDLRQGHRLLPGQGRLDAHRRPLPGDAGGQRDRRRWTSADLRHGAGRQAPGHRRRRCRLLRGRRQQSGHHARGLEPGQRSGICRPSSSPRTTAMPSPRRAPGRSRATTSPTARRVRHAGRDHRRLRLLRGPRGGLRGHRPGPRAEDRRCSR